MIASPVSAMVDTDTITGKCRNEQEMRSLFEKTMAISSNAHVCMLANRVLAGNEASISILRKTLLVRS